MIQESPKKILIVDDDELNSTALAKRLERRGYVAKVITNGTTLLEVLEKDQVDLVLLDIVMPEIDGLTLLKQIRTKYNSDELPVIMVTVIADGSDIFDAFASGANDYITKPVNIDVAASRIKGQLSAVELLIERIRKKEIEAINAVVITYHHEVNNPLAIAKSELQLLTKAQQSVDPKNLNKVIKSLDRIEEILKKIKEVADKNQVPYEFYASKSKMVKVKKN